MKKFKTAVIGAGNVAHHLCTILKKTNNFPIYIHARTKESACELGDKFDIPNGNDINKIPKADIYIFSVNDSALVELCNNKNLKKIIANSLCVHTAGCISMNILSKLSENFGVLYPLQTFSKHIKLYFNEIPVCIEANNEMNLRILDSLARQLSHDIRKINSIERMKIHTAAVFASNFTNHMYALSEELLNSYGLDYNILYPLIKETARKAIQNSPSKTQTGPAVRKDTETLLKHITILKSEPDLQKIYTVISDSIRHFNSETND